MRDYLSIDIGGTMIKFAHIDSSGNMIKKGEVKTSKNKEKFLSDIDKIVQNYANQIKGLAFCAPGKIERTKIRFGGALPFLDGIDFAQIYGGTYHFPVAIINDGKASILAESWLGSLQNEKNCAAITLGTGIGGGIILNGHLLEGVHFQAGELSFMICDYTQKKNMEGALGSLGSAVKLVQSINSRINYPDKDDGLNAFNAIKKQLPEAIKIFDSYCRTIAVLILNIQTVIDVNKVAIGGGISAQSILIEGINKAYDRLVNCSNPLIGETLTKPSIVATKFRNDSNLYGALYNLLLNIDKESKH